MQFRIRVPSGVHLTATIGQGDLKSMGITGNLRFYSNNGYVLVHDAGGPGTIQAGVGLLGNVDAVIAKVQNGPALRQVRLQAIGSGRVRVAMPTTVGASYSIATQLPAAIDSSVWRREGRSANAHRAPRSRRRQPGAAGCRHRNSRSIRAAASEVTVASARHWRTK